jgi:hypothetical protein
MMGFLSASVLAAVLAAPAPSPTAAKPKSHGNALSGTVTRMDAAASNFVVRESSGRETTLRRTNATHVTGGNLKPGVRVAVRWLEKDGHKIATSVRVEAPAIAASTPTVSTPSSP